MEIRLQLALPREELSVPVIRRILKHALDTIGVTRDTISDLELALTEACTNVLDHAGGTEYEVVASIDGDCCVIEVVDRGAGYAAGVAEPAPEHAEEGRGLQIMQAVVDHVTVEKAPREGTIVRLEKQLRMDRQLFSSR